MDNLWKGRLQTKLTDMANDFNSSIRVDRLMYKEDILGSIAHVTMLGECDIIPKNEALEIAECLKAIEMDITNGSLEIDYNSEDIHTFIENELTKRLPVLGKKLHTARSRNDQVALDTRLYLANESEKIINLLKTFINTLLELSNKNLDTIMTGYTHLQRAQPITLAEHLMAYSGMFLRDIERIKDTIKRIKVSPLGSCALAGTTYPIDRFLTAKLLNFNDVSFNSMDGVSDRDFCIELSSNIAIIMMHLSRMSEEFILWSSSEFKYIEIADAYSTGSSIMPQKKNCDIAELVRGKTGRAYGNLITILTVMKGLPLAYNKDMQEDKESIFDSIDTVKMCLSLLNEMTTTIKINKANMLKSAEEGFINSTDCADYLTKKGMPFRTAYKITGEIVAYCIQKNTVLEKLTIKEYKSFSEIFESDIYTAISMLNCVEKRTSYGAPSKISVQKQIQVVKEKLKE